MKSVCELLTKLSNCLSSEECFDQYIKHISQFGLTNGILLTVSNNEIGEYDIYSNYNPQFVSEYEELGGVSNDISAQLLLNGPKKLLHFNPTENHIRSLDFLNRDITKEELAIEELSFDFNIREGYASILNKVAATAIQGIGVSAVGMSQKEYTKDVVPFEKELDQINHLLALSLKRFTPSIKAIHHAELSPRQYDLLRWLADGLRLQEIADNKVHRSIHTINKELYSLRSNFDVSTTEELVAKGMFLGLID